jgi:hypothetical protein
MNIEATVKSLVALDSSNNLICPRWRAPIVGTNPKDFITGLFWCKKTFNGLISLKTIIPGLLEKGRKDMVKLKTS